jgi:dephospho-CoA kinase
MILGITGGIASGKTTVSKLFAALGAPLISADQLAREVVRPGGAPLQQLVELFGFGILQADGTLDRAVLGHRIFTDAEARAAVNRITHPAIAARAEQALQEKVRQGAWLIVYEAPLLFEAGAEGRVDAVLVVTVDENVQLHRLMQRDGLGEAAARERIAAQMPQAQKVARADFVIDNSATIEKTEKAVRALFMRLRQNYGPPVGEGSPG